MQLLTKNGYLIGECTSAMIKSMRRGLEEESTYWALELETKYPKHVWKRMSIFAAEDIGTADPSVIGVVSALWASYNLIREAQGKDREVEGDLLVLAVVTCCRAVKSREVDTLKNYVQERRRAGWKLEVPIWSLDCHTARGRAMGRTEADWWADIDYLPPNGFGRYENYAKLKARGGVLPSES